MPWGVTVMPVCHHLMCTKNKVGRSMKLLNLPLARVVLKRGKMADRAKEMVKNCTLMKTVCDVAVAVEKRGGGRRRISHYW